MVHINESITVGASALQALGPSGPEAACDKNQKILVRGRKFLDTTGDNAEIEEKKLE
jgi:hypothetical protein